MTRTTGSPQLAQEIELCLLMEGHTSDYVKQQMRQLHSKHLTISGYINVEVVSVQKQRNGLIAACTLLASAFAFECTIGSTSMDRKYYGSSIRQHLCECLKLGKVVTFSSFEFQEN